MVQGNLWAYYQNGGFGVPLIDDPDKLGGDMKKRLDMFLQESTEAAAALVTSHRAAVERVAAALLEHGTIGGDEVLALTQGDAQ